MKKYALALVAVFVLVMACGGGGTPDQVAQKFLEGIEAGDGDAVVGCLSAEGIASIDESIADAKTDPEATAALYASMDIEITPDEVAELTPAKLITLMFSNEMFRPEIPDYSIGEAVIDGDVATVPITVDGETIDFELILEEGNWKMDDAAGFM